MLSMRDHLISVCGYYRSYYIEIIYRYCYVTKSVEVEKLYALKCCEIQAVLNNCPSK